jgi:hypothetical protein
MRRPAESLRLALTLLALLGVTAGGIVLLRQVLESPPTRIEVVAPTSTQVASAPPVQFASRQQWANGRPVGEDTARPASLRIAALGVDAPIVPRAIDPDTGAFDLPPDAATVAWWEPGPTPGEQGSAVLAAHVDYGGRVGVFYELADTAPGERVEIGFNDGTIRSFQVTEVVHYPKSSLPLEEVFRSGGPPVLTLVTCGGEFDRVTRHYSDNTVLTAVPVAS